MKQQENMVARTFTHSTSLHKELFPPLFLSLEEEEEEEVEQQEIRKGGPFSSTGQVFWSRPVVRKGVNRLKTKSFSNRLRNSIESKIRRKKKTQFECCFCCSSLKKKKRVRSFFYCVADGTS